ncbi:hypothetical protein LQ327_25055 [Actinomycetospora endophytica]|uniref:Secreted protein n=1 Tax=Actinomycetospora endophytica TaxID=2291215 RepID=A0ABS8PEF5_9PSEU|nr:hypothetical protein [Actinomycetospora endophytica]MCD2196647.1 hypothetical protein [Actinomycetospora endophytica]
MLAITLGVVVVALVVGALAVRRRRDGRDAPNSSTYELVDSGAVGFVPGYMPGVRQKAEHYEDAATELVEPPHDRDARIDLEDNTVHVRRGR